MFIFLSFFFFIFFLFIIKSLTSMFSEKKLKKYVIVIHKYNKNKFFEWWFFFNLIKAEYVHMHTNSFNLKKFNVVNWQSISLCWLRAHVAIWCVNDNECLKIILKVKMPNLLMIMNLWIIIDNAFCILKRLVKWRNQRLTMAEKLSTVLWCFKLMKINVKTF